MVGDGLGEAILSSRICQIHLVADVGEIVQHVRVNICVSQDTGQKGAKRAPNCMHPERVQGIVIAEPSFDLVAEEPRDQPGGNADNHGPVGIHETAGRSDHDQSRDRSGAKTEDARLAFGERFSHWPNKRGDGCREGGGCESVRGNHIRRNRAASIKTIPTHPEHPCADHTDHHVMRRHVFLAKAKALAEDQAQNQRRPARGHMHYRATGKVNRVDAGLCIPNPVHEAINSPDNVGLREINQEHPADHEEAYR